MSTPVIPHLLGAFLLTSLLFLSCSTPPVKIPEIANLPPTTLQEAMNPRTLGATLTEEPPRLMSVTNNLTEEKPQFAFQIYSVKSVQQLNDAPTPSLLVTHNNGAITIFGLLGWDTVRTVAGGYDIWYRGEAVNVTIYSDQFGNTVRVNTRKVRGQEEHNTLLEYVMRYVPPKYVYDPNGPIVIHGPMLFDYKVTGPAWGLAANHPAMPAVVIGRNP